MKKFFIAFVLAFAASLAHAGVYETRVDFFSGNYELTLHNDTPYFVSCRAESTLSGWYNIVIAPWGSYSMFFTGPSMYRWNCWR